MAWVTVKSLLSVRPNVGRESEHESLESVGEDVNEVSVSVSIGGGVPMLVILNIFRFGGGERASEERMCDVRREKRNERERKERKKRVGNWNMNKH